MSFWAAVIVLYAIHVSFLSLFNLLAIRLTIGIWASWQAIAVAAIVSIFPVAVAARKTREMYRQERLTVEGNPAVFIAEEAWRSGKPVVAVIDEDGNFQMQHLDTDSPREDL